MKYLNESAVRAIGVDWNALLDIIPRVTARLQSQEFAQPVKPYLRYKDPVNRIIAMPAYVGGEFAVAGIKWIASFPGNTDRNLPRAHAVVVLNDADTGIPRAVINTALVSGIRTAAVSGAVIRNYLDLRAESGRRYNFGIIGLGPIGRLHLEMILAAFPEAVDRVFVYDLRAERLHDLPEALRSKVTVCDDWQSVFRQSDIFMTCTVSNTRYINERPLQPSLHLNVSLRDYDKTFFGYADCVVVDNWEEVCRENTDIEMAHQQLGLQEEDVLTIIDVLCHDALKPFRDKVIMFNPMGMAVFDMAVGQHYYERAIERKLGVVLED